MKEPLKLPSLAKRTPWQLLALLLLLAAGLAGAFLAPHPFVRAVIGAFMVLCGALLLLLWRLAVSTHERVERTKWDQANKAMADFMQVMIDIMPNPAFFKDVEGRYRGTNAAFEKLLGLSKSELIGKTIGDVAPAEIVDKHQEHDQALLATPGHQVYEAPLKAWDGEHQIIFIKTTYQRPDGTIGGIIGILKDITQRLRSEQELEQLRRFSESTVQTMTEGLVLTDAEGRFTFVNPAAARMLGYTPSEMIDRQVLSFVPKDQHASCPPGRREALQGHLRPLRARLPAPRQHPPHLPGQRRPPHPGGPARRDHGRPDRHHRPQADGGGDPGPVPPRRADRSLQPARLHDPGRARRSRPPPACRRGSR